MWANHCIMPTPFGWLRVRRCLCLTVQFSDVLLPKSNTPFRASLFLLGIALNQRSKHLAKPPLDVELVTQACLGFPLGFPAEELSPLMLCGGSRSIGASPPCGSDGHVGT